MSDATRLAAKALEIIMAHYSRDPDDQMPPTVFAVKDDEVVAELPLNFDDDFMKSVSVTAASLFLQSSGCDGSIFVSEAWMAEYAVGEKMERPMDSPRRVEVLMCEISTADHYINIVHKMQRDEAGKLTGFEEFQRFDTLNNSTNEMSSRFDFFNGLPTSKETVH